jgi:hypothetical protein
MLVDLDESGLDAAAPSGQVLMSLRENHHRAAPTASARNDNQGSVKAGLR